MEKDQQMPKKIAWIRRRGAKRVVIGAVMASVIIILVVVSFFYTPYDPNATDLKARMVAPSAAHLFGTDQLGRDILSRVMAGGPGLHEHRHDGAVGHDGAGCGDRHAGWLF